MASNQPPKRCFRQWQDDEFPSAPALRDAIDEAWTPSDLNEIIAYLQNALLVSIIQCVDHCDLCNHRSEYGWRSDGSWLWKASLAHYVKCHHVRPPANMIDHIRSRSFAIPESDEVNIKELDWPFKMPWE